jgi:hypothetical protein
MTKVLVMALVAAFLVTGARGQKSNPAPSCPRLAKLALPHAKITAAERIAPGTYAPMTTMTPWTAGDAALYKSLPAFCRIAVEAQPSADSDIKVEIWMPESDWNGKFQGRGNGGFAGEIDYHGLAMAVHQGYASAGTDTGHSAGGTDARWALNHPEKITDFGFRAIHEMTLTAKAVMNEFYSHHLQHSYFSSCSNGGRQALMEAQRFPADYDGIVAGAPANYWTHLLTSAVWDAQATTREPASYIPASKLPAIARAVNDACDAQDGVTDGVLNDPRKCHFEPVTLLCQSEDADTCLTPPQAEALKKLYAGAHDSGGARIFPGLLPGAEEGPGGWSLWITGQAPGGSLLFAFGGGFFANMVYAQPDWNYRAADIGQLAKAGDARLAKDLNATNADLTPFQARGGKLIVYHGWNDPAISALNTIDYFHAVQTAMGHDKVEQFARLYMVPGMQHCDGGPGADYFGQDGPSPVSTDAEHSVQLAVERWVEKSTAPSAIIASRYSGRRGGGSLQMTRPLCAYPQVASYKGQGDSNDAANFLCVAGQEPAAK